MAARFFARVMSLLVLVMPAAAFAADRVALVVANGGYAGRFSHLESPLNDAAIVEESLKNAGFSVTVVTDRSRNDLLRAIQAFGDQAVGKEVAVFYYSGHGLEVDGRNYLIPIGAQINEQRDVPIEGILLDDVRGQINQARIRVVVLDACRNNPFKKGSGGGLAGLSAASGEAVLFSTSPNTAAEDASGKYSPFARSFAKEIQAPGVEIGLAFRKIADDVLLETRARQEPANWIQLTGVPFFFVPSDGQADHGQSMERSATPAAVRPSSSRRGSAASSAGTVAFVGNAVDSSRNFLPGKDRGMPVASLEQESWDLCKFATTPGPCKAYVDRYKRGRFADLAQVRLGELAEAGRSTAPADRDEAIGPALAATSQTTGPNQSAGRGAGLTGITGITIGAMESALDCKLYAVTSGRSSVYADASRIAASQVWKTSLYRDCINHFAGIRDALSAALASSGTLSVGGGSVGTGGYTLAARISETTNGSSTTSVAGVGGGFGLASAGLGLEVSVTLRDKAGRIVFGAPIKQRLETASAVDTGSTLAGSSLSGDGVYATLQRQVAIAVARRVAFHFAPLTVLNVKDHKIQLNFGTPLLQSGDIVNVTSSDGFTAIRYRINSTSPGRAIAEKYSDGDEAQIRAGNIATFVDEDSGMDDQNRFERVELP